MNSPCIIFEGDKSHPDGYGRLWINGRKIYAHRLAWIKSNGIIPNNLFVLHKCDNPPCINVEHLFLGTNKDNMRDCVNKGRSTKGTRNGQAKLTQSQVDRIRDLYEYDDMTQQEIANEFNISNQQVNLIINNKRWVSNE